MKTLTKITLASLMATSLFGCEVGMAQKYEWIENDQECPLTFPIGVSQGGVGGVSSIPLVNERSDGKEKECHYYGKPKSYSTVELEKLSAEWKRE